MWRGFPLVVAVVGICSSIAAFVALLEVKAPGWGVVALEHWSTIAVALSIALALAFGRRAPVGPGAAQVAAAAAAVAFAVVALAKVYTGSISVSHVAAALSWASEAQALGVGALALGLIGPRMRGPAGWIGFLVAVCVTVGLAGYATSLKFDFEASVWFLAAGTAASLAGSAAARMDKR